MKQLGLYFLKLRVIETTRKPTLIGPRNQPIKSCVSRNREEPRSQNLLSSPTAPRLSHFALRQGEKSRDPGDEADKETAVLSQPQTGTRAKVFRIRFSLRQTAKHPVEVHFLEKVIFFIGCFQDGGRASIGCSVFKSWLKACLPLRIAASDGMK